MPADHLSFANAVAIQGDRRIVAAGDGPNGFAIVRYMPDGTLDENFGTGGRAQTAFSARFAAMAQALAIQRDGRLVVAGAVATSSGPDANYATALARYQK